MNIYYVTSPFQYICAEEAKSFYKTDKDILILAIKDTERGVQQLKKVFNKDGWDKVIYYNGQSRSFFIPRLVKKLIKINGSKDFNKFFFAEYTSWFANVLRANFKFEQQIYFDDGTLTIYEYEKFIKNQIPFERKRFFQDLILKLQRVIPPNSVICPDNFELFTIFDLEPEPDNYQRNTFSAYRSGIKTDDYYASDAAIGIIGQGSVGDKYQFTIKEYVEVIEKLASKYNKLLYFPHRNESDEVKKEILKIANIEYYTPSLPLELAISTENLRLSKLYGVISTAFYTLAILYPKIEIKLLELGHESLAEKESESHALMIEHAKKHLLSKSS